MNRKQREQRRRDRIYWDEVRREDRRRLQAAEATARIVDRFSEDQSPVLAQAGPPLLTAVEIACMPWEDRERQSREAGWQQLGPGRWVKRYGPPPEPKLGVAPAFLGSAMTFGNGRSRFNHYGLDPASDIGDPGVVRDMNTPEVKEWCELHGHRWVETDDGYGGPASFGSTKELNRCMAETGFNRYDHGRLTDPTQESKDRFARKHGQAFKPGECLRLTDDEVEEMFDGNGE